MHGAQARGQRTQRGVSARLPGSQHGLLPHNAIGLGPHLEGLACGIRHDPVAAQHLDQLLRFVGDGHLRWKKTTKCTDHHRSFKFIQIRCILYTSYSVVQHRCKSFQAEQNLCQKRMGSYKSTPKISQNILQNLSGIFPNISKKRRKQCNVQLPGDGIIPLPMLLLRLLGQSIVVATCLEHPTWLVSISTRPTESFTPMGTAP